MPRPAIILHSFARQAYATVNDKLAPNYQADELVKTANQTPVF